MVVPLIGFRVYINFDLKLSAQVDCIYTYTYIKTESKKKTIKVGNIKKTNYLGGYLSEILSICSEFETIRVPKKKTPTFNRNFKVNHHFKIVFKYSSSQRLCAKKANTNVR